MTATITESKEAESEDSQKTDRRRGRQPGKGGNRRKGVPWTGRGQEVELEEAALSDVALAHGGVVPGTQKTNGRSSAEAPC